MTTTTRDFVLPNGLQIEGNLTSVNGTIPTNGELLIGDSINGRFSIGSLAVSNGVLTTSSAGGITLSTNATSINVASTLVARDTSGNFTAGVITANLNGTATFATQLATPRTINGVAFDGSANISFTSDSVPQGTTNLYYTPALAAASAPVQTVFGRTGNVVLTSPDVTGALGFTPVAASSIGIANGVAALGSNGTVPLSQLPAAVAGGLNFLGLWNASTNSPTLTSGSGVKGGMYKVSVPGTTLVDGNSSWNLGDLIVFDGTTWDKIDGISSEVISVFGRTGAVTLLPSDLTTAWGTQAQNTFLAAPAGTSGAVSFRVMAPSDLPLATTSTVGAVSVSTGLSVASGILTANVVTVAGRTGNVVLAVADVSGAAPLISPALTGTPTAPTAIAGTNTTQIASTAFVATALNSVGISASGGGASFNGTVTVKQVTFDTLQTTLATTSATVIYSIPVTEACSGKFVAQVIDTSNDLHLVEMLIGTDTINVWMTTYAVLISNAALGTFSAQLSGGNLQVTFTPASSTTMIAKIYGSLLL
jgi:hypothetical protein